MNHISKKYKKTSMGDTSTYWHTTYKKIFGNPKARSFNKKEEKLIDMALACRVQHILVLKWLLMPLEPS